MAFEEEEFTSVRRAHMLRRRVPSGVRLLAILSAFILLLVAGMSGMAVLFVSQVFDRVTPWTEADLQWRAQRTAHEFASQAELLVISGDADEIRRQLAAYTRDAGYDAVVVTNAKSELLVTQGKLEMPLLDLFQGRPREVRRLGRGIVAWEPVEIEGELVGKVGVVISTNRLDEGEHLRRRMVLLAALSSAAALLLSFLFVYLYLRPLVNFTESTLSELRKLNATLEAKVHRRTAALAASERQLQASLDELRRLQQRLVKSSRAAGMAEVATNVLHNVGNVLNSVNVGATVAVEQLKRSPTSGLADACGLLAEHQQDLPAFFASDPRAQLVLPYLQELTAAIEADKAIAIDELARLQKHVDHIKVIVSTQQNLARGGNLVERFSLRELLDEALQLQQATFSKLHVVVERDYAEVDGVSADRHKVFQILVNLLRNSAEALAGTSGARVIRVRLSAPTAECFAIAVEDTGCGIPKENLTKVFSHGFTTKPDGHGFGLHGSACAAIEMGGKLSVRSDGPRRGAVFSLELPVDPPVEQSSSNVDRSDSNRQRAALAS